METLNTVINKTIGLYIRKEHNGENLSTGYGRLQWLRYELEEHEGSIETFIDDTRVPLKLATLLEEIFIGNIDVVLIWSIEEIDRYMFKHLALQCREKKIPIISFCKSHEWINEQVKLIAEEARLINIKKVG